VRNAPEVQHQLWRGALGPPGRSRLVARSVVFISSRIFRSVSATTVASPAEVTFTRGFLLLH